MVTGKIYEDHCSSAFAGLFFKISGEHSLLVVCICESLQKGSEDHETASGYFW